MLAYNLQKYFSTYVYHNSKNRLLHSLASGLHFPLPKASYTQHSSKSHSAEDLHVSVAEDGAVTT